MPELSGLEIAAIAKEVNDKLRGAYVNNVYSIDETQVIRFRGSDSADVLLVMSPKYGAWLSTKVSERAVTSEFTTKLRKEIVRSKLASAEQVDLDRVLALDFSGAGRTRKVILEMMPPGNIVVTGEDDRIILALNDVRSQKRRIVAGGVYAPPQQSRLSPDGVNSSNIERRMAGASTLGLALGRSVALPRKYVVEVLTRLGLAEEKGVSEMEGRMQELVETITKLVQEARLQPRPTIAKTESEVEVYAIRPKSQNMLREVSSLSEAADEVILPLILEEVEQQKLSGETRTVRELEATRNQLRKQAELLAARAREVREIARRIATESPSDALAVVSRSGDLIPKEVILGVREGTTPAAVVSRVFSYAKRLEKESSDARNAAEGISKRMKRLEVKPRRHMERLSVVKKEWYERFRWFYTSRGRLAVGGRDAQSNSILIKRHLEKEDTVYHADLFGSPFFVLKGGHEQTMDEVREVGQATASFSSAWKTGLSAADAYWVEPNQVSSSAPSGEYLPRGSFMILGRKNPVPNNLIELAIGVEASGRIISGPESAIGWVAQAYVVIRPDREKVSDTAKKVLKELESLSGRKLRDSLSLDDLIRNLPQGGGKLVRRRSSKKDKSESES